MASFTCSKDVKTYLDLCREKENMILEELNCFPIGLFNPERKELKKRKKDLKLGLKQLRTDITFFQNLFKQYTTFGSNLFLPFVAMYLTAKENEEYVLVADVQEDDAMLAMATHTYPNNFFGKNYNIITTHSNGQKLLNQNSTGLCGGDTDDIHDFLLVCKDKKYICLEQKDRYTLLDGINLVDSYHYYPYLLDTAYELIDLKFSDANLGDSDRLNKILSYVKKK